MKRRFTKTLSQDWGLIERLNSVMPFPDADWVKKMTYGEVLDFFADRGIEIGIERQLGREGGYVDSIPLGTGMQIGGWHAEWESAAISGIENAIAILRQIHPEKVQRLIKEIQTPAPEPEEEDTPF